jgi:hypothetical protein
MIFALAACSSPSPPQILRSQNPPTFAPGEYVTTARTVAAIDADAFRLALLAAKRKDTTALRTMRDDGRVFDLPRRTRVAFISADGQLATAMVEEVEGIDLCAAEIESGGYVGSRVVIPCNSVMPKVAPAK